MASIEAQRYVLEHRRRMAEDPEYRATIERLLDTLPPPESWSDEFIAALGLKRGPTQPPTTETT